MISSSFGDLFNENENDDGLSDDLKTADLEPKSLKLLLSQLRLTCVELKVALKLQGTNFLLHINQLTKKHNALLNEVASMKKIINQSISQNTFVDANDGINATLPNGLHENGEFDNTTLSNAFHQAVNIPTCVTPVTDSPEIINTPFNVNESAQSNMNVESLESQCTIADMATQIVDCIEETMNNTWKHIPHGERINPDLRNHAINALKGIINESYKNNNTSNISAVGDMIDVAESLGVQSVSLDDVLEHVTENNAIPQACHRSPPDTAQCGLSPLVAVHHDPESACEPRVADPSVDPPITVQCKDGLHISLQLEHDPGFALHTCSNACVHVKKQKKMEKHKRRQQKENRRKLSFANIRKYIMRHLVDTVGEGVKIAKLHKILSCNHDSLLTGNDKENIRIIQICMRANNEASAITIEKNMLPDVFLDDSERYYKVEFENIPGNKKASSTELFGDPSHSSHLKENNEISENKAVVMNGCDNDISPDTLSDDVTIRNQIEDDISPNPITTAAENSSKHKLKRKSDSNADESKKSRKSVPNAIESIERKSDSNADESKKSRKSVPNAIESIERKSDNFTTTNSSIHPPLVLISDDSVESVGNSIHQHNPSTPSVRPVILSNEIIKGDHVKNVFSLIAKEVTGSPMNEIITQTSPAEQTTSQKGKMRKSTPSQRVIEAGGPIENVIELDLPDRQISHYTRTNRSHVSYANSSTQQSFQSLLHQSSLDPRLQTLGTSIYQKVNCKTKMNRGKKKDIYVRTHKKQLSTIPVTIREHLTWDVDDDDEEIVIIRRPSIDDDVEIIEIDNAPIVLD